MFIYVPSCISHDQKSATLSGSLVYSGAIQRQVVCAVKLAVADLRSTMFGKQPNDRY